MVTRFVPFDKLSMNPLREMEKALGAGFVDEDGLKESTGFVHGSPAHEKYYRMFPIPGTRFKKDFLEVLAKRTFYETGTSRIPAGYTYLGQFITHDISRLDIGTKVPGVLSVETDTLTQLSTPSLDLNSLYGEVDEFGSHIPNKAGKFQSQFTRKSGKKRELIFDIPRCRKKPETSYLIGDTRNDENFITAQLHVLFMNAHNCLVDLYMVQGKCNESQAFRMARQELTLLYQKIIVNDYLKRVMDEKVYHNLFEDNGFKGLFTSIKAEEPRIPIEFSGAAMRFGHSMVLPIYTLKKDISVELPTLFKLTGKGREWERIEKEDLIIEWEFLFDMGKYGGTDDFNKAMPIDPALADDLSRLRNEKKKLKNLGKRNQERGNELALPCGQDVVDYLQAKDINYCNSMGLVKIDPADVEDQYFHDLVKTWGLSRKMPLWTYLLTEPYFRAKDERHQKLGPLGSIIVGEVFKNLLIGSRTSIYDDNSKLENGMFLTYMSKKEPAFDIENIEMSDLVYFTYY